MSEQLQHPNFKRLRFKQYWLGSLIFITLTMLSLGGFTRLTGSGLSMVDWQLIKGMRPPISAAEWEKEFKRYQSFPEYQTQAASFSLADFKFIFFMEYSHRMLGRFIGLLTLLPFLWLWWKNALRFEEKLRFGALFMLVSLQGVVGWYMVKSGLVAQPSVSHYRLALHLGLALVFLGSLSLLLSNYIPPLRKPVNGTKTERVVLLGLFVMFCVQLTYGAFKAGLKAGLVSSTYPKMLGEWVPHQALLQGGWGWRNWIENPFFVHFLHRHLGVALALGLLGYCGWRLWQTQVRTEQITLSAMLVLTLLTPFLGIFTLISQVALWPAALHQLISSLLFLLLLLTLRRNFSTKQ